MPQGHGHICHTTPIENGAESCQSVSITEGGENQRTLVRKIVMDDPFGRAGFEPDLVDCGGLEPLALEDFIGGLQQLVSADVANSGEGHVRLLRGVGPSGK